METKEMIEKLNYKAKNIKAKMEPMFFYEVAVKLEKYQRENEALKCRCKTLGQAVLCEFCPMECRYRPDGFMDKVKEEIYKHGR